MNDDVVVSKKGKEVGKPLSQIPMPHPPFPYRVKKKLQDGKFHKFISMLKHLSVNILLVKDLERKSRHAKFMKDLLTKKRAVSFKIEKNLHQHSVIFSMSFIQKGYIRVILLSLPGFVSLNLLGMMQSWGQY